MLNKTQKRNCKNKFCKLYTKKFIKLFPFLVIKNGKRNKKLQKGLKNSTMKTCKLYFCNEGCKGTIFEEGKKFPKMNKEILEEYGKKVLQQTRKELFTNKTNILIDNVHNKTPKRISKIYKKKGAISICGKYIPNGSIDLMSKYI